MSERILVTGATGNTGSLVADGLRDAGVEVVAMARSEAHRARLTARGFMAVHGDFDDPPGLRRALDGVDRAYLVCTPDERLIARETAFVSGRVIPVILSRGQNGV